MISFKSLIIDDDPIAADLLYSICEFIDEVEILSIKSNIEEGISWLKENRADILFLDVEMPKYSGLDLLKSGIQIPPTVLISSHRSYALDGFEYDVVDFLEKPVSIDRLRLTTEKLKKSVLAKQLLSSFEQEISFRSNNSTVKVKCSKITHIEAYGDYLKIYCGEDQYLVNQTMKKMAEELSKYGFERIHRKHIVNKARVKVKKSKEIVLDNDLILAIGRSYNPKI